MALGDVQMRSRFAATHAKGQVKNFTYYHARFTTTNLCLLSVLNISLEKNLTKYHVRFAAMNLSFLSPLKRNHLFWKNQLNVPWTNDT